MDEHEPTFYQQAAEIIGMPTYQNFGGSSTNWDLLVEHARHKKPLLKIASERRMTFQAVQLGITMALLCMAIKRLAQQRGVQDAGDTGPPRRGTTDVPGDGQEYRARRGPVAGPPV